MKSLRIEPISEKTRESFYSLALEYLPYSDYDKVRSREKNFSKAYLAALLDEQIIGVAFGWPRLLDVQNDMSFALDGICIMQPFQNHHFGSLLLQAMEKACQSFGCKTISVGSAGGYVEHFYIRNGFLPQCYKVNSEQGIVIEKEYISLSDYETYERKNPYGFVVMEKTLG